MSNGIVMVLAFVHWIVTSLHASGIFTCNTMLHACSSTKYEDHEMMDAAASIDHMDHPLE